MNKSALNYEEVMVSDITKRLRASIGMGAVNGDSFERGVDASEVTFNEQHEACGRVITDDHPPAAQPEQRVVGSIADALDELVMLIGFIREGEYTPDSFTCQPAKEALRQYRQQPEQSVPDGWQPIESAPKTGEEIALLWGGKVVTGFYLDNSDKSVPWEGFRTHSMVPTPAGKPSMWHPLPASPKPGGE